MNNNNNLPSLRGLGLLPDERVENTLRPMDRPDFHDHTGHVDHALVTVLRLEAVGIHPSNFRDPRLGYPGGLSNADPYVYQASALPHATREARDAGSIIPVPYQTGLLPRPIEMIAQPSDHVRAAVEQLNYPSGRPVRPVEHVSAVPQPSPAPRNGSDIAGGRGEDVRANNILPYHGAHDTFGHLHKTDAASTRVKHQREQSSEAKVADIIPPGEIFDCFLGRPRKIQARDGDSKRAEHAEQRYSMMSCEDMMENPLYEDGDEELSFIEFEQTMLERYTAKTVRQKEEFRSKRVKRE